MTSANHPAAYSVRRGRGTPLLFVHGNGVDHRLLLELDDCFSADGEWERIYLDLPGFGQTSALEGEGGLPELAAWLDSTVTELLGTQPFALVANSMGGLLACDLVTRRAHQCLGMALLAPAVDPVPEHRTLPHPALLSEDPELLASLPEAEADLYAEMAVVKTRENWERFRRAALPGIRAADAQAVQRLSARYTLPSLPGASLAGFDRPSVIITGRQDAVVGCEDQWNLCRSWPRTSYAALDGAGHNVHLDRPEAVRTLLRNWSASVLGG